MRTLRKLWVVRLVMFVTALSLMSLQVTPAFALSHRLALAREAARPRPVLPDILTRRGKDASAARALRGLPPAARPVADVRTLTPMQMRRLAGRGPLRSQALAGAPMPWQKSLRDVNLCTGDLFKSYTDVQVAPARGAGLVLQRTYNSDGGRVGPYGIGWTDAYQLSVEEAGDDGVPRTDFFGHPHSYHRDADGLYTPPPYLHDQLVSTYGQAQADGSQDVVDDTDTGLDGTTKHYIANGRLANGGVVRSCDWIQDRHNNRTTLAYGQAIVTDDGQARQALTQVTDPSGRSLAYTWANLGSAAAPHWRVTQVQGPAYRVLYAYYAEGDAGAGGADFPLRSVTLDPDGLARTTTYAYTGFTGPDANGVSQTEYGLLASVSDPLAAADSAWGQGHRVSYQYGQVGPLQTVCVTQVSEPSSGTSHAFAISYTPAGYFSGTVTGVTDLDQWTSDNRYAIHFVLFTDDRLRATALGTTAYLDMMYGWWYDGANNLTDSLGVTDDHYAYGQNGNLLAHSSGEAWGSASTAGMPGFPGTDSTAYYDAAQYFQKQSATDADGHTTTMGVGADTAGAPGDPDPNPGDRGETLWVQDAGYNDSSSPSYHKQYAYAYNQYGQKTGETNLNGVVTQYTYGAANDPAHGFYDLGNLIRVVQDPGDGTHLNRTTTMHYDVMGRVLQSTDPKGQESDFTYNALGQPLTVTSKGVGGDVQETVTYAYDGNGRTHSVTDNGKTTTLAYEPGNDRVSGVTDPVTGTVGYTYTLSGERATMTLPGGGTWTYRYIRHPQYLMDHSLATDTYSPDPDKIGLRLMSITDDQGRAVTYCISPYGRLYGVISNGTYDAQGYRMSSQATWCGYEGDAYDGAAVYDPAQPFEADGGYGGGPSHGWLTQAQTSWAWQGGGNQWQARLVSENDYTYDDAGQRRTNRVTAANYDGTSTTTRPESYGYDDLDRLKAVDYGDGQTQGYAFDAMGNRTQRQDSVAGTTGYACDAANRLTVTTGAGAATYASDSDGNVLTDGTRANVWDSQNRLASCTVGGVTTAYTYGADGLRRSSTVGAGTPGAVTTFYVYDGTMMVREMKAGSDGNLHPSATYLCGPRGPECRIDEAQTPTEGYFLPGYYSPGYYDPFSPSAWVNPNPAGSAPLVRGRTAWYVYDGLGSVVGETDCNGHLTASAKFDVYGAKRQGGSGTASSRQGFVGALGHVTDAETGLVYMRARYYDPQTGRFVSEDPAAEGANWFTYCDNSPVNETDESGKSPSLWRVESFTLVGDIFLFMAVVASQQGRYGVATAEAGLASAMFGLAATGGNLSSSEAFARAMFAATAPCLGVIRALMIEAGAASDTLAKPIVLLSVANALICLGIMNSMDAESACTP